MIEKRFVRTLTILNVAILGLTWRAHAQAPAAGSTGSSGTAVIATPSTQATGEFQQSVPQGTASPTPMALTLQDAIVRGLRANLGLLTSEQSTVQSKGERLQNLSALLPNVQGTVQETVQQVNLGALGFGKVSVPGFKIPLIIGPFSYSTAEAQASVPVFNWGNWQAYRAAKERLRGSELSLKDARDLVVLAVSNAYLEIIASAARVDAIQAQVNTAQVLFDRASDQKRAGVVPAIDVLRAQVELQQQQQALLVQKNQLEKDKLTLGRVIGLPNGQQFTVADPTPPVPMEAVNLDEALTKAYANRPDYQAAEAQVHASELSVRAAKAEWYPTLALSGYYGDQGPTFAFSHGIFSLTGSLNFNIFDGRRIRGEVMQREADLNNSRNQLQNLKGQIDFDVRTALLDLKASSDQVAVAKSNSQLANETLRQSQDRFTAGVADNVEVVQAQESVATANQNLINAQYSNNLAKVELARALGLAEQGIRTYFAKQP